MAGGVNDQLALDTATDAANQPQPFRTLDPAEADGTACMSCDAGAEWRVYETRRWRDLCERCLSEWLRGRGMPVPHGVIPY
jgi:hypothetical protein